MNKSEYLLKLTKEAISKLSNNEISLSVVIQQAIRIARLRNDFENLWWLEKEMISIEDQKARNKIRLEISPHFTKNKFKKIKQDQIESTIAERKLKNFDIETGNFENEEKICGLSVKEIEDKIKFTENETDLLSGSIPGSSNLFSNRKNFELKIGVVNTLNGYRNILNKITHRVSNFLSHTEKQLYLGKTNSDIFEANRAFVDERLKIISPDVLEKFSSIANRINEDFDSESGNQALLSCRRILKSLADKIYPPTDERKKGSDGEERKLTDDKFINRLWQYVYEKMKKKKKGKLLQAQISDLGARSNGIYDLSSKGVHAEVDIYEVNQCIIQTYLTVGDILRLSEEESALKAD